MTLRINLTSVMVDDQRKALEFYTQQPTDFGTVTVAIFDDTCGNLIQIASQG